VAVLLLVAPSAAFAVEVDRICWKSDVPDVCEVLEVAQGNVTYTGPGTRRLVLGEYAGAAQRFVPRTEAPIRDLRSARGWHIVVSAVLQKEDLPRLRIRFFGPDWSVRATKEALMMLEQVEIGRLFGETDEVLAFQSNEEHSYNSRTSVWLLPERGGPKELIESNAVLGRFSKGSNTARPGVWISRQSYDGLHSDTKGWVDEFWAWDPARRSLILEPR
jgi:hypothetical protein